MYKELIQLSNKKQTTQLKNGQRTCRHFSKEDIQMAQQAHDKMLNITNHQRNANQNHNEISPDTY